MASGPTLAEDVLDLTNAGWGRAGNHHLQASVSFLNGDRAVGSEGGAEAYHRLQTWLMYQYYSYFDKTYLGTLVGGEISVGVGYVSPEATNPPRQPEPSENWKPVHFKSEGAFDYALVHWDGLVAGRIVFGAGGGVEFGSSWYSVNGNTYPLILGRLQLFFGERVALHAKYQYIPITSDAARDLSYRIQQHHTEAFVSYRHFYVGAQVRSIVVIVPKTGTLVANDIGGIIGALF